MESIDFLSIGDITVDDFIRLKTAHIHEEKGELSPELCITFGDKLEYEFRKQVRAVGNSANAAVSAARLGLRTGFISDAGEDESGRGCREELLQNKVITDYFRLHQGMITNFHYVLWYGADRTILVKHQEYPYKMPELPVEPKWMYLSSIGQSSLPYHKEIGAYLSAHPNVKLAFQPGTFQMEFGTEALSEVYKNTAVFFCNVEEAQRILKITEKDIKVLMVKLRELGPKIVVITDGQKGAYAYDGTEGYSMPIYPGDAYERTGAGDAFSSTFTSALALGKTMLEALMWGPVNSMSVVKFIGAQEGLLSREKLEGYLANAPADYKPTKIM